MGKEKTKEVQRRRMKLWTLDEENKLLDFLIANNPIEVPSVKVYYEKLIKDHKLNRHHMLIKHKVTSMKKAYYRILDWKRMAIENGATGARDDRLMEEYMERKCPNFKKLEIICSPDFPVKKYRQLPRNFHDFEEINLSVKDPENTFEDIRVKIEEPELSIPDPLQEFQSFQNPKDSSKERNEEQESLKRMKLEIDKAKLLIEKEKIAMQREQNQAEAQYKILELEQEGILKRLQIEKDAELRKYELSLKYKAKPES